MLPPVYVQLEQYLSSFLIARLARRVMALRRALVVQADSRAREVVETGQFRGGVSLSLLSKVNYGIRQMLRARLRLNNNTEKQKIIRLFMRRVLMACRARDKTSHYNYDMRRRDVIDY